MEICAFVHSSIHLSGMPRAYILVLVVGGRTGGGRTGAHVGGWRTCDARAGIRPYIRLCIRPYIRAYIPPYIRPYSRPYIRPYMRLYIEHSSVNRGLNRSSITKDLSVRP